MSFPFVLGLAAIGAIAGYTAGILTGIFLTTGSLSLGALERGERDE